MDSMGLFQTTLLALTFPFVLGQITSLDFVRKQSANVSELASYNLAVTSARSMTTCASVCAQEVVADCRSVLYDRDTGDCWVYRVLWTGSGEGDTRWRYYALAGNLADLGGQWAEFNTPYRVDSVDYTAVDLNAAGTNLIGKTSIIFRVKTNNDAHILLQQDAANYADNVIEIVLGGWGNTKAVIRNAQQGATLASYTISAGGMVSGAQFLYFWVSYGDGVIAVGQGDLAGQSQMMSWDMTPLHALNYIAVGTGYGSDGYWVFQADA